MTKLTPKQQRFVQEYLIDLNAAASARRAGYSVRSADAAARTGSRLLRQEAVRTAIRRAMLERQKRTEITADYVLSNLMEIVERSMQRAPVLSRRGEQLVDGEDRHVWRFDGRTASRALELMGRHLGMFAEHARTPVSGDFSISWEGGQAQFIEEPLPTRTKDDRINAVIELFQNRLGETIDLAQAARSAAMSERTFYRAFRRSTGMTPHQWLLTARLKRAQERLELSDDSVERIALECGFESPITFRQRFREMFGTAPSVWRKNFRPEA